MIAISVAMLSLVMGFLGAMMGVGGATFLVPAMVFTLDMSPIEAMPVSLICALATAVSGTLINPLQKEKLKMALALVPTAIIGVMIFTPLAYVLSSKTLLLLFSIFLFIIILMSVFSKANEKHQNKKIEQNDYMFFLFVSFVSGSSAGLFGIGGGIIMVPLLSLYSHILIREAMQVSLFVMIFTSVAGLLLHQSNADVPWNLGLSAVLGAVPAGMLGGIARIHISEQNLKRIFTFFALFTAIITMLKALKN